MELIAIIKLIKRFLRLNRKKHKLRVDLNGNILFFKRI